jgi:hypothetical protein
VFEQCRQSLRERDEGLLQVERGHVLITVSPKPTFPGFRAVVGQDRPFASWATVDRASHAQQAREPAS